GGGMSPVERILGEFATQPAAAPRQSAAAAALREASLPTRRDENWHYANLRALEGLSRFAPVAERSDAAASYAPALPESLPGFSRRVLGDGRMQPGSAPTDAPALMRLGGLSASESWGTASEFERRGDGRFGLVTQLFSTDFLALRATGQQSLE